MFNLMPHIGAVYPPNNYTIFEEWIQGLLWAPNVKTDRCFIPVNFTSYHVNNNYGNDKEARKFIQNFIDELDPNIKWFCVCQYDDGVLVDWKGKDVLEFNMSKKIGVEMPLLCQPHPYEFQTAIKYFANFVGSKTHPIRLNANHLKDNPDYYISFEQHKIEEYCRIIQESIFTLCFRGYGANSFRIAEAIQYGSIPVYISDEFIKPFDADFEEYGVLIEAKDAGRINEILSAIPPSEIMAKQDKLPEVYRKYYSYEGALKQIIKHLEAEFIDRKQG